MINPFNKGCKSFLRFGLQRQDPVLEYHDRTLGGLETDLDAEWMLEHLATSVVANGNGLPCLSGHLAYVLQGQGQGDKKQNVIGIIGFFSSSKMT